MLAARPDKTDNLTASRTPIEEWVEQAWLAAYQLFNDGRLAGAATLVRASDRVLLTGVGIGLDVARFGAVALEESAYAAVAEHAFDVASGSRMLGPGDLLIGLDTGSQETPAALARARFAGLRTIGLTDRDLTLIDADVLVPYPDSRQTDGAPRSPLAACAILTLLAARLQPATRLAFEATALGRHFEYLREARDSAREVAAATGDGQSRLILAASGPSRWVSEGIARQINAARPTSESVVALAPHIMDIQSAEWPLHPGDILITIEPEFQTSGSPQPAARDRTLCHWSIGGSPRNAQIYTRLGIESPAVASLGAQFVLEMLLEELNAS